MIPSPGVCWWPCHMWGTGQGEEEPGGPFLTSQEGWHAWKRHPGRHPQVIRGPQLCWARQAGKDQKHTFTLGLRLRDLSLQSSNSVVETSTGPFGLHRKSSTFHHKLGFGSTPQLPPFLVSWLDSRSAPYVLSLQVSSTLQILQS